MKTTFELNGSSRTIDTDAKRSLLWVLRTDLGLTGTKYGCGVGECGACTVLVDGVAVRACTTRLEQVAGKQVQTIEGLAVGETLHPVQQAFVDHDALQCGFCTPGMIMNAVGLLRETPTPNREAIVRAMDQNLCRCGAHPRILAAVEQAAAKGGE